MKNVLTAFLLLTCSICCGQNLIPNGDFEHYSSCPGSPAQLYLATPWINPATNISGTSGTPEYYNACALSGTSVYVPQNTFGFQFAHSGSGYAGIFLYQPQYLNVREYLEVQLTSTLIANTCYFFEMYISLAEKSWYNNDNIGVYFSNTLVSGINNSSNLPFIPQINNVPGQYPDTANWLLVSGNYVASGTENYIIIGGFTTDSVAAPIFVDTTSFSSPCAYIYVDDVSLIPCGNDRIDEKIKTPVSLYPNPFTDKLNIQTQNYEETEIILYDILSGKLSQQTFVNTTTLNTDQLASGMYLYEVKIKDKIINHGKLIKR